MEIGGVGWGWGWGALNMAHYQPRTQNFMSILSIFLLHSTQSERLEGMPLGVCVFASWSVCRSRRILYTMDPLIAPNRKGGGFCFDLRPSGRTVRTSVDSDFSEVFGSTSLKLYTEIRYGLRIMHVE